MNTRRALILLAVVTALGVLLLVWPHVRLFFQVDACLDSGGRWNHATGSCEHSPLFTGDCWRQQLRSSRLCASCSRALIDSATIPGVFVALQDWILNHRQYLVPIVFGCLIVRWLWESRRPAQ